jgi:hypothetical protein
MPHIKKSIMQWLLIIPVLASFSSELPAIASSSLSLSKAECGDFHQAIIALATRGQVAIIAEGVPGHPHFSVQDTAKLTQPMLVNDAIKSVADVYDYSVQQEMNIFVLKKRYSSIDDFPAITQAEANHTLVQLQQISEPFNPHGLSHRIQFLAPQGPNLRPDQILILHPLIDSFAGSLTPEQNAEMQKSKLLVSSLTPNQKTIIQKMRLSLYVQMPLDQIALLPPVLKQSEQSAVFCWQDTYAAKHVFGYTLPEQRGKQTVVRFHALGHSTGEEDYGNFTPDPDPAGSDPTAPSGSAVQSDNPPTETLADVIAELNAKSIGVVHADIDPAVAAKPITLAGIDNAPPLKILQALADVYGLRLTNSMPDHPTVFTLTFPNVAPPADLAELPSALRQTFPEPFARATHLERIVAEEQQFYDFWQTPRNPKHSDQASHPADIEETPADLERAMLERKRASSGNVEFKAGLDSINKAKATFPTLRNAAIRRLRALIEPKLQAHPSGIPISDLGEQEHEALATIFLVEAAQAMGDLLTQKVPDTVLHFDQASLGGGIHEDAHPPSFDVQFHIPNPVGGLEIDGGGMGVPYYKDYDADGKK